MRRQLESVVRDSLQKIGIEISYADTGNRNLYRDSLRGAISVQRPFNIIQVGANDGKHGDPIYDFVKSNQKHTNIILIEPLELLIPYLEENYAYHSSAEILNKAIAGDDASTLQLYRVKQEYWSEIDAGYGAGLPEYRVPTGVTTSNKSRLMQWVSKNVQADSTPEEIIEAITVDTVSPESVIDCSQNINEVHLLQVDTEGVDDKVVYSFFKDNIYPNIINIESKYLSKERQKNYDTELEDYGYEVYDYTQGEKLAIRK